MLFSLCDRVRHIVGAVVSSIMGEGRKVLMTEVLASERFELMQNQFIWVFASAPLDGIKVIHTDHAMKMNLNIRDLWRSVYCKRNPDADLKTLQFPGN